MGASFGIPNLRLLIESIQLLAARLATKAWHADAPTLNSILHLTPIASWRAYFKALYAFKFLNGFPPGYFVLLISGLVIPNNLFNLLLDF